MIADKKTKKSLGIQVLGKGSVDKMLAITVTALTIKASLEELENMDCAYDSPFSTAIHPFFYMVNVLLNKINNEINK